MHKQAAVESGHGGIVMACAAVLHAVVGGGPLMADTQVGAPVDGQTIALQHENNTGMFVNFLPLTARGAPAYGKVDTRYHDINFNPGKTPDRIVVFPNGADNRLIYKIAAPAPLVADAAVELALRSQDLSLRAYVSFDGEVWRDLGDQNSSFVLAGTRGAEAFLVKFQGTKRSGHPQTLQFWADCGQSKAGREKKLAPAPADADDDFGAGRVQILSGDVCLHPPAYYHAVAGRALSVSEAMTYSALEADQKKWALTFYVDNDNREVQSGILEVYVPEFAAEANVEVESFYGGERDGRISQPPDKIELDGQDVAPPSVDGWGWLESGPYVEVDQGLEMLLTWNRLRPESDAIVTLHNPVSFKGRCGYQYLSTGNEWKELGTPWPGTPIPADAGKSPFKVKVVCREEAPKWKFALNGTTWDNAPDDYYLPIDDADGRGNSLDGWRVMGLYPRGEKPASRIEGAKKRLIIVYSLDSDGNPLDDWPGVGSPENPKNDMFQPGEQRKVRVVIGR